MIIKSSNPLNCDCQLFVFFFLHSVKLLPMFFVSSLQWNHNFVISFFLSILVLKRFQIVHKIFVTNFLFSVMCVLFAQPGTDKKRLPTCKPWGSYGCPRIFCTRVFKACFWTICCYYVFYIFMLLFSFACCQIK